MSDPDGDPGDGDGDGDGDGAVARSRDPAQAIDDLAHLLARVAGLRRAVAWDGAAFTLPDLHRAAALVRDHQPVDPPGVAASQDALDDLVAWALARGARLAPGLRVVATGRGARVEATAAIAAGASLVEVPVAAMVRTAAVASSHPTLAPWLGDAPLFGPGTLMLWLVCARHGAGPPDPHAAYVAALPGEVPGTALSWPRSPGEHLVAAATGRRFLAGVLQLYCLVYRRLRDTPAPARPLPLEAFTLQRWLWAGAILSSRQTAIAGDLALVPVWDLLDHDDGLGAETTELAGDRLRCVAGVDVTPGDAVAMYYGHRTPTEHWVYGGFAPPGPPDGEPAALPFPLPREAPLRRDKLVWLLAERDRPVEVPVGRGALDAARARARWYALDGDELDRLGVASVADVWDAPPRLSAAGEARAAALLDAWLRRCAGPATPVDPFSRDHAFILAAAHARYAGLIPGPGGVRLLDDADVVAVDAFLAAAPGAPLLLRDDLHAAGLTFSAIRGSGTWVGAVVDGVVTGVAMHARNGHLLVHAPGPAPADAATLAAHAVACSGARAVAGLVGAAAQVDAARAALGLAAWPVAHDRRERVCAVELAALRAPPGAASTQARRAGAADLAAVVALRARAAQLDAARGQLDDGRLWLVEADGAPVATAALGRVVADTVAVTDVWTAPAARAAATPAGSSPRRWRRLVPPASRARSSWSTPTTPRPAPPTTRSASATSATRRSWYSRDLTPERPVTGVSEEEP
ncbi:MAG: hypothetical protein H6709_01470 [Kofleriaceae bacterium]|nr:hypothetical protein [Kofleriaceae bacterium]